MAAIISEGTAAVYAYFDTLIKVRRANPTDDYTSQLIHGLYAGERRLTDNELHRTFTLLMHGGLHTVQSSLCSAMTFLATHPDQQDALRCDSTLTLGAVEEILRWEPPVWNTRRTMKEVEISGVVIPAGELILCSALGANNDDTEFDHPEEVDFNRKANKHLTFAVGVHRCIGAHLARLEMRVALEELHRRLPTYELDPNQPPVRHLGSVNGFRELQLIVGGGTNSDE
jgi:cytochrome P450